MPPASASPPLVSASPRGPAAAGENAPSCRSAPRLQLPRRRSQPRTRRLTMKMRRWALLLLPLAGLLAALGANAEAAGPDPKDWDKVVSKAAGYYRATQAADGSWGGKQAPGVTGLALTGLLRCGALD